MKKINLSLFFGIAILNLLITGISFTQPQHFKPVWQGGAFNPMQIYIVEAKYNLLDLELGDEIGIFDGSKCVGVGIVGSIPPSFSNPLLVVTSKDDDSRSQVLPQQLI